MLDQCALAQGSRDGYLQIPFLFSMISGLNRSVKINASQLFSYGGFSKVNPANRSLFKKFGFNDRFSTNELVYLIQTNKVPPLALGYFPDLDQHVHKHGRNDALGGESRPACSKDFRQFFVMGSRFKGSHLDRDGGQRTGLDQRQ